MAWLEGEWIDGTHKFDSSHESKKQGLVVWARVYLVGQVKVYM